MDSLPDFLRILQVMLGIGLVIFVHELGHFLAARWHRVRVEVFSLGFGPPLFSFQRGDTIYQVAMIPLGGFVRMAGEERRSDGLPPAEDDLCAKSVGARFFVYSAGVIMNVLFGLVVFPILFTVGLPVTPPVLGPPVPGGPAWSQGLAEGTEVLEVRGQTVYEFGHIVSGVALGDPEEVELVIRHPDGREEAIALQAERDPRGLNSIGTGELPLVTDDAGHHVLDIREDSPAWRAGLRPGDVLLETRGGAPGISPRDALRIATDLGRPVELRVAGADGTPRMVRVVPEESDVLGPPLVGISPPIQHVLGLRGSAHGLGLRKDDRILRVADTPIRRQGDLARALLAHVDSSAVLTVRRPQTGEDATPSAGTEIEVSVPVPDRATALRLADDIALGSDVFTSEIVVRPGQAAARDGLKDGDVVLEVDGEPCATWEDVRAQVARAGREERPTEILVARAGVDDPILRNIRPTASLRPQYGIGFTYRQEVFRTDGPLEAIGVGAIFSWRFLQDTWLTLKAIASNQVDASSAMGGPIAISALSYTIAAAGMAKFFFFLCVLSINLAVINVLPIPILDGGHLFFLIVEKIKGSPVSERVLGYSQMVGLVLILSLFVFVTYNDLRNWVPGLFGN